MSSPELSWYPGMSYASSAYSLRYCLLRLMKRGAVWALYSRRSSSCIKGYISTCATQNLHSRTTTTLLVNPYPLSTWSPSIQLKTIGGASLLCSSCVYRLSNMAWTSVGVLPMSFPSLLRHNLRRPASGLPTSALSCQKSREQAFE